MKQKLLISLFLLVTSAKSEALALVDCIQIALSNKEALKVSALDLQSAQQTLKGSYSNILPSLMFSGSSGETIGDLTFDATSTGISLSQNIYDGGIWWNTIAQSKNSYKIAEQFDRQVKINIIRGVHLTYFNYVADTRAPSPRTRRGEGIVFEIKFFTVVIVKILYSGHHYSVTWNFTTRNITKY